MMKEKVKKTGSVIKLLYYCSFKLNESIILNLEFISNY